MPSNAYQQTLTTLLDDVIDLLDAHRQLRTGNVGRQWGLGGLNRAVVVMAVSAWEAYVEDVVLEAVDALRPAGAALGMWPAINATARSQVGRFNNPNSQKVRTLFQDTIGIADVTAGWQWQNCTPAVARTNLDAVMTQRHHVAHGVNPRPVIHNGVAKRIPVLIRNLGRFTDATVYDHLTTTLGLPAPW